MNALASEGGLALFESARQALAECKSVDEVRGWADRAAATKAYARIAKDKSLEVDAAEIRIRAERRLGELLTEHKASGNMAKGHRFAGGTCEEPPAPTLAEAGIDKKLSARAQKLAAVPEAEFEAEVGEWRDRVSAEGERVAARLESSGADWQAALQRKTTPDEVVAEGLVSDVMDDIMADHAAAMKIIEADAPLAAAWDEVKTFSSKYAQLEKLYEERCREVKEAQADASRWMRKFQALEKATKAAKS